MLALVGPTCTGKTALSIKVCRHLAADGRSGGEVIACDSRTIYKEFDVGTAKPTPAEQGGVPHHLIDVADPSQDFTAADFKNQGRQAVEAIAARGHLPVVCGGTGFYARALLEDLAIPQVAPQPELRAQLRLLAESEGNQALHNKLADLDPKSAARLPANDVFRIIRALEVTMTSGIPFSQAAGKTAPPYRTHWIGLTVKDRELHRRLIEKRLNEQLESGLLEETRRLYERYGASQKILNTVNYRDLVAFIEGRATWEEALQGCRTHNYQLARKQMIWFKALPEITWFAVDETEPEAIEQSVLALAVRMQNELRQGAF